MLFSLSVVSEKAQGQISIGIGIENRSGSSDMKNTYFT